MNDGGECRSPGSARTAVLVLGGVLCGVVVALELSFGVWLTWQELFPVPSKWIGAAIGVMATVAGPVSIYGVWRTGRRSSWPRATTAARMARSGTIAGALSLLVIYTTYSP